MSELTINLDKIPFMGSNEQQSNSAGTINVRRCGSSRLVSAPSATRRFREIDSFLSSNVFKDLTIKVESREFMVHKFIFLARSSLIAEYFKDAPNVTSITLTGISADIFESVLSYIYTDELNKKQHPQEIFAAASKLQIEGLKEMAVRSLLQQVSEEKYPETLLEIFMFAEKYQLAELRLQAYQKLIKDLPEAKIGNALSVEELKVLIEEKKIEQKKMLFESLSMDDLQEMIERKKQAERISE